MFNTNNFLKIRLKYLAFLAVLATDNVPILKTRSLGTQVDGIANRQRACLPKFGKLCSLAFHHSSGHLITYSCVAYLNTLPAGLCFKPLEYILITIFKEKNNYVCCLCDILSRYIVLEIKFNMAWVGCISVANHNWSYEPRI